MTRDAAAVYHQDETTQHGCQVAPTPAAPVGCAIPPPTTHPGSIVQPRERLSPGGPPPAAARRAPVAPHIQMYNDIRWNHDRQRMERRVMHIDSDNNYYRQEWFDLETGELMFS